MACNLQQCILLSHPVLIISGFYEAPRIYNQIVLLTFDVISNRFCEIMWFNQSISSFDLKMSELNN